jgi:hypothetical protein
MGENILNYLAIKNDSNKKRHDYESVYEPYFRNLKNKELKMLEIGIFRGGSVKTFRDYFIKGNIYCIDINESSVNRVINEERIYSFKVDQGNREQLKELMDKIGKVDIILDDGGHCMDHMQISFGFLFSYLNKGGIYIIEDVHTSYPYHEIPTEKLGNIGDFRKRWNIQKDFYNTTYIMLKNYEIFGKIYSVFMTNEEMEYINNNINHFDLNIRNDYESVCCIMKHK